MITVELGMKKSNAERGTMIPECRLTTSTILYTEQAHTLALQIWMQKRNMVSLW